MVIDARNSAQKQTLSELTTIKSEVKDQKKIVDGVSVQMNILLNKVDACLKRETNKSANAIVDPCSTVNNLESEEIHFSGNNFNHMERVRKALTETFKLKHFRSCRSCSDAWQALLRFDAYSCR